MAEANEIDQSLMNLLQQNIQVGRRRGGGRWKGDIEGGGETLGCLLMCP